MTQPVTNLDTTLSYSAFQVAGDAEPLLVSSSNSLLRDADSALFYALDFFSWVIRAYPGARLVAAAQACMQKPFADPVMQRYPWSPDLENETNQFQFPLLAIYRKEATTNRKTAAWEHDMCSFDLVYILPPLIASQAEQILPILNAVAQSIRFKASQGGDPNYTPPGGLQGQQPWSLKFAGVEEFGFDRWSFGVWQTGGNMRFPFLQMSGTFTERDMPIRGIPFAGADISLSIIAGDGTSPGTLVQVATQQAPTITSLSVATGPVAGGTAVTITGTLFLSGAIVMVGRQRAWTANVTSATTITLTTPAYSNPGSVSVTVLNRDGQSVVSPTPFTYV